MDYLAKIENEFDKSFVSDDYLYASHLLHSFNPLTPNIKSFYRTKITELLEALAKEAIGVIDEDEARRGSVDPVIYYNAQGWNEHRNLVISAFERRGIKI